MAPGGQQLLSKYFGKRPGTPAPQPAPPAPPPTAAPVVSEDTLLTDLSFLTHSRLDLPSRARTASHAWEQAAKRKRGESSSSNPRPSKKASTTGGSSSGSKNPDPVAEDDDDDEVEVVEVVDSAPAPAPLASASSSSSRSGQGGRRKGPAEWHKDLVPSQARQTSFVKKVSYHDRSQGRKGRARAGMRVRDGIWRRGGKGRHFGC